MRYRSLLAFCVLLMPLSASADFQQRTAAMERYKKGQYEEALPLFLELGGNDRKETLQGESLLMAALCAEKMGDSARAMEIAGSIVSEPYATFTRMSVLREQKAWEKIIALSGSEKIDQWPDKLIPLAHLIRADACIGIGDPGAAAREYALAAQNTLLPAPKAYALLLQGSAEEKAGRDSDEVLAVYGQVVELAPRGGGTLQRAHLARAGILAKQGREEPAIAEIKTLEASGSTDVYWVAAAQVAYGDAYAALGKPDLARAHYQKACDIPSIPDDLLKEAREGLNRLPSTSSKS